MCEIKAVHLGDSAGGFSKTAQNYKSPLNRGFLLKNKKRSGGKKPPDRVAIFDMLKGYASIHHHFSGKNLPTVGLKLEKVNSR